MRRLLILISIFILTSISAFAAKLPDDVTEYIESSIPGTDIRFDGVIILPDNTIYLPLFPSLFSDVNHLKIKETYPKDLLLNQKPDIVIFNNDFAMLKVLTDNNGHRTVVHMATPPLQVRTGLLPQDMLVPSGLILPENLKGIIGNLKIDTQSEDIIFSTEKENFQELMDETVAEENQQLIPQLKNKTLFVSTNYSKNIQVMQPAKANPDYSLTQKSIPIDIKAVSNGKFLLVTSYERPFIDVISVADSRFIKQINLPSFPQEIVIDEDNHKAYVTSPTKSTIFVIDLKTMSLVQKILVNGYCEKLLLKGDKLFYIDKLKNNIWAIETQKNYELKNIGRFPNISAIEFIDNNVYLSSRTKSRVAIVDYETLGLVSEFATSNKPVAMQNYKEYLYVLCAQNNIIEKIDIFSGKIVESIHLGTEGFSARFNPIENSDLAVIADVKKNIYTIFDLSKGKILKSYSINVPMNNIVITDKVQLFK